MTDTDKLIGLCPKLKRIYLSPTCADCACEERLWCEDNNGPCECGAEWTAYDIAQAEQQQPVEVREPFVPSWPPPKMETVLEKAQQVVYEYSISPHWNQQDYKHLFALELVKSHHLSRPAVTPTFTRNELIKFADDTRRAWAETSPGGNTNEFW